MLDESAVEYVRLALVVGRHDPDYVDSYFGPPRLREEANRDDRPLQDLLIAANRLAAILDGISPGSADQALRHHFLRVHSHALAFRLGMLAGCTSTFDDEARVLFGVEVPGLRESEYAEAMRELADVLPGSGAVADRYRSFRERLLVSPDLVSPVFLLALDLARARTKAQLGLPATETFSLELVTNQPWSAWNWYKGDFHSLIQLNTSLPNYVDRLVDLACHEGYPGHHVFQSMRERDYFLDRGWLEHSVVPLHSPVTLMSEGAAMTAAELIFPDPERLTIDVNLVYPASQIDSSLAPTVLRVTKLVERLEPANCDVARAFLGGDISREDAADWLVKYSLLSPERAKERLKFIQRFRSYIACYSAGPLLVREFLSHYDEDRRWPAYTALISLPVSPQLLVERGTPAAIAFEERTREATLSSPRVAGLG